MNEMTPTPNIPMMPEMFANAFPPMVPQMQFANGFLQNIFHNVKLGQLVKASDREASIAANHARIALSKMDMLSQFITFQARTTDVFKNLEHLEEMRKIDRAVRSEELNRIRLENQNLFYESKISEMEYKKRSKEFEEEYGDGVKQA